MNEPKEYSLLEIQKLLGNMQEFLEPAGFECYLLKIGWYNSSVSSIFQLPYDPETVAALVISLPKMFEDTFLPWLKVQEQLSIIQDPLDQCMITIFKKLRTILGNIDCEVIQDFELTPTRRPKIIMQTVGHVSGAAKFYQRKDLKEDDPWNKDKNMMGVCLHPIYGGWFAFRGVIIMKNIWCRELQQLEPKSLLNNNMELINLLTLFNEHWKDRKYRDFVPVKERYSNLQMKYFDTCPSERHKLIRDILEVGLYY